MLDVRRNGDADDGPESPGAQINVARLTLEGTREAVDLTANEARLFLLLAASPGEWLETQHVIEHVWRDDADERAWPKATQLVVRLRRKLRRAGYRARIRISKARGFQLDPQDPSSPGVARAAEAT